MAHLREVRDRPAWQEMPAEFRKRFDEPLPQASLPLAEVLQDVSEGIMPFPLGNVHPRFWAWFMGAGNITGALADFLAAVMGSNLAGGNHAAALVDQQVVRWCKEIVGFPAIASGTLTSGGSVANLIALTVARNASAGEDLGEWGVESMARPLRFYGSDQLHSCHRKAIEILGLGHRALRLIPSDEISDLIAGFADGYRRRSPPVCSPPASSPMPVASTRARSMTCRRLQLLPKRRASGWTAASAH